MADENPPSPANAYERPRVLVVEDEFLVGLMLEEDLRLMGYDVLGPFRRLDAARVAARAEDFELALLDVNLDGVMVYPLADELLSRGVPILFLSGYAGASLPDRFRSQPRISKPHEYDGLVRALRRLAER